MSASCWAFEHREEQQCTRQWTFQSMSRSLALELGDLENSSLWKGKFFCPQGPALLSNRCPQLSEKESNCDSCFFFTFFFYVIFYFLPLQRARAQGLVNSLSLIMVDASLGTIQCLEEIVSTCLAWVWIVFVILDVCYIKMVVIAVNAFVGLKPILLCLSLLVLLHFFSRSRSLCRKMK